MADTSLRIDAYVRDMAAIAARSNKQKLRVWVEAILEREAEKAVPGVKSIAKK